MPTTTAANVRRLSSSCSMTKLHSAAQMGAVAMMTRSVAAGVDGSVRARMNVMLTNESAREMPATWRGCPPVGHARPSLAQRSLDCGRACDRHSSTPTVHVEKTLRMTTMDHAVTSGVRRTSSASGLSTSTPNSTIARGYCSQRVPTKAMREAMAEGRRETGGDVEEGCLSVTGSCSEP